MADEMIKKVAKEVVEELEDFLEERKVPDRRVGHDPSNPYSHPDKDRRSGIDRREQSRKKNRD